MSTDFVQQALFLASKLGVLGVIATVSDTVKGVFGIQCIAQRVFAAARLNANVALTRAAVQVLRSSVHLVSTGTSLRRHLLAFVPSLVLPHLLALKAL